jgi:hypothetical protein
MPKDIVTGAIPVRTACPSSSPSLQGRGPIGQGHTVEPYLITLDSSAKAHVDFKHEGTEFIVLVAGGMRYRYGQEVFDMSPGDSILFDAAAPHGPQYFDSPTSYISVISWRGGRKKFCNSGLFLGAIVGKQLIKGGGAHTFFRSFRVTSVDRGADRK